MNEAITILCTAETAKILKTIAFKENCRFESEPYDNKQLVKIFVQDPMQAFRIGAQHGEIILRSKLPEK